MWACPPLVHIKSLPGPSWSPPFRTGALLPQLLLLLWSKLNVTSSERLFWSPNLKKVPSPAINHRKVSSVLCDNLNKGRGYTHVCVHAKSLQSCPTLCDPLDCSLLGSSVHGIPQARKLEWVAMPSSRASFQPRDQTSVSFVSLHWQVGSLPLAPPGNPRYIYIYIQLIHFLIQQKLMQHYKANIFQYE